MSSFSLYHTCDKFQRGIREIREVYAQYKKILHSRAHFRELPEDEGGITCK